MQWSVVKVGGSLFDLPDLGSRLRSWLDEYGAADVLLVPGGGAAADMVRDLDRRHALGEDISHWLALRAMTLNAAFLQALLPEAPIVAGLEWCSLRCSVPYPPEAPARACSLGPRWRFGLVGERSTNTNTALAILDAHAFACADEDRPDCLPHSWQVSSDAVAARCAVVLGAQQLVLLKSVTLPAGLDWPEAGRQGLVDTAMADVLRQAPALEVTAINFRAWTPGVARPAAPPAHGPCGR